MLSVLSEVADAVKEPDLLRELLRVIAWVDAQARLSVIRECLLRLREKGDLEALRKWLERYAMGLEENVAAIEGERVRLFCLERD